MSYFWVNHKQTVRQERKGGYLWSPFANTNGARNRTYDSMAETQPGDIIFSYANAEIGALGVVESKAKKATKPAEFGSSGENWSAEGWLVAVKFRELSKPLKPKQHMDQLRPLLPERNAPIQGNGNGNQSCYLAPISNALGLKMLELLGESPVVGCAEDEDIEQILSTPMLSETEKQQLIQARRGQGRFRASVLSIEPKCRVTGVAVPELLRASHIKPWRDSNNAERLDGNNGLMLSPHIDVLFDRGFISFSDTGTILVSKRLSPDVPLHWHINLSRNVGLFNEQQTAYLKFHRHSFGF